MKGQLSINNTGKRSYKLKDILVYPSDF